MKQTKTQKFVQQIQDTQTEARLLDGLRCPSGKEAHHIANATWRAQHPHEPPHALCKYRKKNDKRCKLSLIKALVRVSWRDGVSRVDEYGEVVSPGKYEGREGETDERLCALAAHLVRGGHLSVENCEMRIGAGTLREAFPTLTAKYEQRPDFTAILYRDPESTPGPDQATGGAGVQWGVEVRDRLCRLLPAQFDEARFKVGISASYLPNGSQSERATAVVEWAQSHPDRRVALEKVLQRLLTHRNPPATNSTTITVTNTGSMSDCAIGPGATSVYIGNVRTPKKPGER